MTGYGLGFSLQPEPKRAVAVPCGPEDDEGRRQYEMRWLFRDQVCTAPFFGKRAEVGKALMDEIKAHAIKERCRLEEILKNARYGEIKAPRTHT